jgi:F0F1-type ATP synthase assembly protein I
MPGKVQQAFELATNTVAGVFVGMLLLVGIIVWFLFRPMFRTT